MDLKQQTSDQQSSNETKQRCQRCLNHNICVARKNHDCPFKKAEHIATCMNCHLIDSRRAYNQNIVASLEPTIDVVGDGDHGKASKKQRIPTCNTCKMHGVTSLLKDHKKKCKFNNCTCEKCGFVKGRRRIMAQQVKLRRMQNASTKQQPEPTSELLSSTKPLPENCHSLPSLSPSGTSFSSLASAMTSPEPSLLHASSQIQGSSACGSCLFYAQQIDQLQKTYAAMLQQSALAQRTSGICVVLVDKSQVGSLPGYGINCRQLRQLDTFHWQQWLNQQQISGASFLPQLISLPGTQVHYEPEASRILSGSANIVSSLPQTHGL